MNESRKHHYIPQFYLSGFTENHKKNDKIWVIDKIRKKKYCSSLSNVACERDFYSLEIDGINKDYLEIIFSKVEFLGSKILNKIIKDAKLPEKESEDFKNLIAFMALMYSRSPRFRNIVKENFNLNKCEFNEDKHLIILGMLLRPYIDFPDLLIKDWILFECPDNEELICSDCPVCYSNELGEKDCYISFPLNKRYALCSFPRTKFLNVRAINTLTIFDSTQYIFYSGNPFYYANDKGEVFLEKHLLED